MLPTDSWSSRTGTDLTQRADNGQSPGKTMGKAERNPPFSLLQEVGTETSVGLGIAKAGNRQAGTTSRYKDTGNEC